MMLFKNILVGRPSWNNIQ